MKNLWRWFKTLLKEHDKIVLKRTKSARNPVSSLKKNTSNNSSRLPNMIKSSEKMDKSSPKVPPIDMKFLDINKDDLIDLRKMKSEK